MFSISVKLMVRKSVRVKSFVLKSRQSHDSKFNQFYRDKNRKLFVSSVSFGHSRINMSPDKVLQSHLRVDNKVRVTLLYKFVYVLATIAPFAQFLAQLLKLENVVVEGQRYRKWEDGLPFVNMAQFTRCMTVKFDVITNHLAKDIALLGWVKAATAVLCSEHSNLSHHIVYLYRTYILDRRDSIMRAIRFWPTGIIIFSLGCSSRDMYGLPSTLASNWSTTVSP